MTADEWDAIASLIEHGWPGDFSAAASDAYRVLLAESDAVQVLQAVRVLLHRGQRFRPSAAEIMAAMTRDAGRPTWPEAYQLIFGPGGVLQARAAPGSYGSEGERRRAQAEASEERARGMHPLIAAFVRVQGVEHLKRIPVGTHGGDGRDFGLLERERLAKEWERFTEITDERLAVTLAAGGRRGELGQMDPLAALGVDRGRPQLPQSAEE